MGQKVNPIGIRLGIVKESNSRWFPSNDTFANILQNDIEIRKYIRKKLSTTSAIAGILIERTGRNVKITIRTAKPGVVIGKRGEDIDKLCLDLKVRYNIVVTIGIEEVRKPDLEAVLVAESVASQLERRIMFRRAMKKAVTNAMRQGAKGIKVSVAGRLGGTDIARTEWYREGRVPLHTLRANIDYGLAEAKTTYGVIGVKVWVFKGEVIGGSSLVENNLSSKIV